MSDAVETVYVDRLDIAEAFLIANGGARQTDERNLFTLVHRFTPGMYIREIYMPAGSVLTSKIHKTEHPFVISKGVVSVYSDNDGPTLLSAPHTGITKPNTRRLLVVHEDTVWTTFHPTQLTDVDEIEAEIIDHHENQLLVDHGKDVRFERLD